MKMDLHPFNESDVMTYNKTLKKLSELGPILTSWLLISHEEEGYYLMAVIEGTDLLGTISLQDDGGVFFRTNKGQNVMMIGQLKQGDDAPILSLEALQDALIYAKRQAKHPIIL